MSQPKLTSEQITQHLQNLPDWSYAEETLTKNFAFQNFTQALQFVNQVGETAETVNHHPDIDIRYNKVVLRLTTHDSGGVTQSDVELAASADDAADVIRQ